MAPRPTGHPGRQPGKMSWHRQLPVCRSASASQNGLLEGPCGPPEPGWHSRDGGLRMPVMGGDRAGAGLVVALLGPVEIGPAGGTMAPLSQPRLRVLLGLL